jgi:transposase InsO family protein
MESTLVGGGAPEALVECPRLFLPHRLPGAGGPAASADPGWRLTGCRNCERSVRRHFSAAILNRPEFPGGGIEPSVGSMGDSYDNALAETVIGLFKTEKIHRRGPWKGLEDVEFATLQRVAW